MDYEQLRKGFTIEVPEFFNFGHDVIDRMAETARNRLAMIWVGESGQSRRLTFRDMKIFSNQVANMLSKHDLAPGDRVLLMLPRLPEWWFAVLGLIKRGIVFVPSAVSLTPKDLEYRCNKGEIKAIITSTANASKVDAIRDAIPTVEKFFLVGEPQEGWLDFVSEISGTSRELVRFSDQSPTRADDPMLIYFTSGTTAHPKIVMHRHSYALAHRVTAQLWHDLGPSDIHWTITDTGWAKTAWGALFGQWLVGATIFIYDYSGPFVARDILKLLEEHGVTTFCAPPTAYRMLILEDLRHYNLAELRHCVSAGEPLNPEVIEVWKQGTGLQLYEGYGQTETVVIIATLPGMEVKPGAMGRPLPPYEVEVLRHDMTPAAIGEEGDVGVKISPVRPPGIFDGYVDADEINAEAFVGDWYLTGDRAYKDEDGYYWFVGRRDDVIKSSGYRIGPFEVESALLEHPAVVEAAVIGVPDELRGQRVKAFVILGHAHEPSDALARELQEHVRKVTAPYKAPREIEFVRELPKTISGKIRRVELRDSELKKLRGPQG